MLYFSTRDKQRTFSFKEVFLNALASDGGLYVPISIPKFSLEKIQTMKNYTVQDMSYDIFNVCVAVSYTQLTLPTTGAV